MSNETPTDPPELPVPTGEVLMEAVGTGPEACRDWAEIFLSWAPEKAVQQMVMNALDPLLVELIVGPDHVDPLISMLRRHYATVRERYPGPFADVERVWGIQRKWWLQFVLDQDQAAESAGGTAGSPVKEDILAPPAAPLTLIASRPQRRRPQEESTEPPSRSGSPSRAGSAAHRPPDPRGQAPIAAGQAEQAVSDSEPSDTDAAAASPPVQRPSSSAPAVPGSASPISVPSRSAATPVRPRITGAPGVPPRRPTKAAASDVGGGARVTAAASASTASRVPPAGLARPALHSPARAGQASLGVHRRRLIEAAYTSYDHVRALSDEFADSSHDLLDLSEWRLGSQGYA